MMIYGYLKPYKGIIPNVLEFMLLSCLLLLLLLQINPSFKNKPYSDFTEVLINQTTYSTANCEQSSHYITVLAQILLIIYYLPLFIIIVTSAVIGLRKLWQIYQQWQRGRNVNIQLLDSVDDELKLDVDTLYTYQTSYVALDDKEYYNN